MKTNGNWAEGIDKTIAEQIEALEPNNVKVWRSGKRESLVVAKISKNGNYGIGVAICSTLDTFDFFIGKEWALRRALKALKCRRTYKPVRSRWEQFPGGWKKSQIKRVLNASKLAANKSAFYKGPPVSLKDGEER